MTTWWAATRWAWSGRPEDAGVLQERVAGWVTQGVSGMRLPDSADWQPSPGQEFKGDGRWKVLVGTKDEGIKNVRALARATWHMAWLVAARGNAHTEQLFQAALRHVTQSPLPETPRRKQGCFRPRVLESMGAVRTARGMVKPWQAP